MWSVTLQSHKDIYRIELRNGQLRCVLKHMLHKTRHSESTQEYPSAMLGITIQNPNPPAKHIASSSAKTLATPKHENQKVQKHRRASANGWSSNCILWCVLAKSCQCSSYLWFCCSLWYGRPSWKQLTLASKVHFDHSLWSYCPYQLARTSGLSRVSQRTQCFQHISTRVPNAAVVGKIRESREPSLIGKEKVYKAEWRVYSARGILRVDCACHKHDDSRTVSGRAQPLSMWAPSCRPSDGCTSHCNELAWGASVRSIPCQSRSLQN